MRRALSILLLLIPAYIFGQVRITGKIVSAKDKKPLSFASVFLSNTGVGDKTNQDGRFTLHNIKNGRYTLVVSCVGYEPYNRSVKVSENIDLPAIELTEKVELLNEVKIRYESKSDRAKYLRIFKKAFLGNTYDAEQCSIINPDIIDFDYSKKKQQLSASTSDFLIIDNMALGYRIRYLVYSFMTNDTSNVTTYVGASSFEPMKGNVLQQRIWQDRRAKAYFGSAMHFLRSCIADAVTENGFIVREVIIPELRPSDSLILRKLRYFKNPFREPGKYNDSIIRWKMLYTTSKTLPTSIDRALFLNEYIKFTNEKGIYAFGHPAKKLFINYKNRINIPPQ
jgi:hypothetical protein